MQALLNTNAKVYLAARSKTKADEAIEWLKQETGGKSAIFLELDLASLDSVRKAADEFKRLAFFGADMPKSTRKANDTRAPQQREGATYFIQ